MTRQNLILIVSLVVIVVGSTAAYIAYRPSADDAGQASNTITREEALQQAREFTPPAGIMCTQALTPAVHTETGATYIFPSGCLAPGWERDDSQSLDDVSVESVTDEIDALNETRLAPTYTPSSQPSAQENSSSPTHQRGNDAVDQKTRDRAADATKRILDEARAYTPSASEGCEIKTTPAVHKATGIRYNFTSTCLPSGWILTSEARGLGHY